MTDSANCKNEHCPDRPYDFDIAIIGAGPAGVATAIGTRSEGPSVIILDGTGPGGQVATSSNIRNFFGVPVTGVSGVELMGIGTEQAVHFGTKFLSPFRAVELTRNPETGILTIHGNAFKQSITAASVVMAIGASARRLEADGLEQFMGNRGVSYGSPQYLVPNEWINKRVGIIGGGNSTGQSALFLAQCHQCEVHIFVRKAGLDEMSDFVYQDVHKLPNVTVHPYSVLRQVKGDGHRMNCAVINKNGTDQDIALDNLFIQIGNEPQTGWLEGKIALDEKGFILTDRDLAESVWSQKDRGRAPFQFETSVPGVFAVGDVRSGSLKRMSVAVGEGHAVSGSVWRFLLEHGKYRELLLNRRGHQVIALPPSAEPPKT